MKHDVEGIIGDGMFALGADVGGDRFRNAEKHQRVINQVRRKVKQNAGAGTGAFAPRVGLQLRTEAVVVRFEANNAAEIAAADDLLHSMKVAVITPILVNGEQPDALPG